MAAKVGYQLEISLIPQLGLTDREKQVLTYRMQGKTLRQIGELVVNHFNGNKISGNRVMQIERKALRKLRHEKRYILINGQQVCAYKNCD